MLYRNESLGIVYETEVYYVSHPLAIKRKTLFLKIELKAFSNRGDFYGHFGKKTLFKYFKIQRNGEEISQFIRKPLF